jgi:hypothetical protein
LDDLRQNANEKNMGRGPWIALRYDKKRRPKEGTNLVVEANSVLGQVFEPTNLIPLAIGIGLVLFAVWVKVKADGN